jgi:transcriptional regulator with XRE-family HTH domain
MNIETANRLLQYRKENRLSQEELAEKIGVSRQAVSKWERAEASPDTDNLIRLAEVYGVSLDEMLTGKKTETPTETPQSEQAEAEPEPEYAEPDPQTAYHKYDRVSFKNGIHVNSKDGDRVHVSFKDGVNVHEKDGDHVHVGWDGIHVDEKGKNRVYTDENGNVMVDESLRKAHNATPAYNFFKHFPFWAIALIAFLAWGFSGVCFGWALSWICFFSIPIYYSLVDAIHKRKPINFAYPVLVVAAYIIFGYFNICGGWALGWIVFLTIPIYYCVCSLFKAADEDKDDE